MNKKTVLIISIFTIILIVAAIVLYENKKFNKDIYINSYEECILQYEESQGKYTCSVGYRSDDQANSYNTCKDNGGKIRCPSNPPIAEDCSLSYTVCSMSFYKPNFVFPTTYEKCRELSYSGGSYYGIDCCELIFFRDSSIEPQYANELVNQCINLNGYEDEDYCTYIIVKAEPERKSELAEKCTETDLTGSGIIRKVCEWALSIK